jgi:osmotically-inducible protein OsmY
VVLNPGYRHTKSVVPARSLRFNAAHDALNLNDSEQAFKDEPRFKSATADYSDRGDFGDYGVYTPLAQSSGFSDMETTRRIYTAMRADASLSKNAQNVEADTVHGRVTLRGHVNATGGKRTIGKISSGMARPENVSNLLEVRPLQAPNRPQFGVSQ